MTSLKSSWDIPEPACPVSARGRAYRPFEHEGAYAFMAEARREEPVFYTPEIGYWVVTHRKDVLSILRDPDRFSASVALSPVKPLPDEVVAYLQANRFTVEPNQVNCDRPKHTRIRNLAARFLNAKRYAALEPDIRRMVREAIDRMKGEKTVDIVEALTYELPARAIFLLLGISDIDARKIKKWGDNRLMVTWGTLSDEELMEAGKALADFFGYCRELVEDRMRNPGDDYPSRLLELRDGNDDALSINEIVCLVFGLLLAGHETTTNASSNVILELLSNRGQWERLVTDPGLIPNAVEEGFRFASPVFAWRRRALTDVEIQGVEIPAGSNILLALGSANRDEAHFEDAETFDVARGDARDHVSFGNGIHFCLGAPLARIELRVILEELTAAFPDMRLVEGQDLSWVKTISFRGPEKLLVELCP